MTIFSKEDQANIDRLATALRSIEITPREMQDMRLLYKNTNGIPFDGFNKRSRPQGPTIKSSSTIGSKIKRALDAPESYYGMNFVGFSRGDSAWRMKDIFRAAIDQAKIFGSDTVVADEEIPWDEAQDYLEEDDEIPDQILADESLSETVREQLIMARVGQGKFRSRVEMISPNCRITGVSAGNFLIASHIKPWRVSSNEERLDGNNGLMLSPHIDKLFDEGYISFTDDGKMMVCSELPVVVLSAWSIQADLATEKLNERQARYMQYHRENVFLGLD